MALETATYLDSLNASWPLGSDAESSSDDHHRLVKACLQRSFPNISAEMRATAVNLNFLTGVDQDIQAKIDAYSASISSLVADLGSAIVSSSFATLESDVASKSARITTISADVASKSGVITTLLGYPRVYSGFVGGSATVGFLPSGWSATSSATGFLRVTHGLGTSGYAVTITPISNASTGQGMVLMLSATAGETHGTNKFRYRFVNNLTGTGAARPCLFVLVVGAE